MSYSLKTIKRTLRFSMALPLLAAMIFAAPLWSADSPEAEKNPKQPRAENDSPQDQVPEQPETPGDFKPSEEISEDFPVPLPSDI